MAKLVKEGGKTYLEIELCTSNPYSNPCRIDVDEFKQVISLLKSKQAPPPMIKKEPVAVPVPTKKVDSGKKKKWRR